MPKVKPLPCPFCGGSAVTWQFGWRIFPKPKKLLYVTECNAVGCPSRHAGGYTATAAIRQWNKRTKP